MRKENHATFRHPQGNEVTTRSKEVQLVEVQLLNYFQAHGNYQDEIRIPSHSMIVTSNKLQLINPPFNSNPSKHPQWSPYQILFAPHRDRSPTPVNVNTKLDSKFVDHPLRMKNETLTMKTSFLQKVFLCLLRTKGHAACDVTKYPMRVKTELKCWIERPLWQKSMPRWRIVVAE